MTALAIIAGFLVYLAVSFTVVVMVVIWAKKRGRRPWLWGLFAALFMYNLVFWDLIPTYVVFKYKCYTESGFWVYKTPEQWKEENPGVAETLTWSDKLENFQSLGITRGYKLNERIAWVFIEHPTPIIPITTQQEMIIDLRSNEPLVKRVRIYSSYKDGSGFLRGWVYHRQKYYRVKEFRALRVEFQKLGGKDNG
ncbi:MAG: hypothetical protein IH594_12655 [Bacteroidales bacterium]|nr:hypothetical protein [Bacteroidales bacterium]